MPEGQPCSGIVDFLQRRLCGGYPTSQAFTHCCCIMPRRKRGRGAGPTRRSSRSSTRALSTVDAAGGGGHHSPSATLGATTPPEGGNQALESSLTALLDLIRSQIQAGQQTPAASQAYSAAQSIATTQPPAGMVTPSVAGNSRMLSTIRSQQGQLCGYGSTLV